MSADIEIFINNVSIKLYRFLLTDTLIYVREKLGIGSSEDYIFYINGKEIEHNEEKNYTVQLFQNYKKMYIKKKIKSNPFLAMNKNKNKANNQIGGKKEVNQINKKNDNKPVNITKENNENKNLKDNPKKVVKNENKKEEENFNKIKEETKKDKKNVKIEEKKDNKKEEKPKEEKKQVQKKVKTEGQEEKKIDKSKEEKIDKSKEKIDESKEEKIDKPKAKINESKEEKIDKPKEKIDESKEEKINIPKEKIDESKEEKINIPKEKIDESKEEKIDKPKEKIDESKEEKIKIPKEKINESEEEKMKKRNKTKKEEKIESDEETYDLSENVYETENLNYDIIENKIDQGIGIEQLTVEEKDKVKIRKELLKTINSFIACLGPPGSGKSTFCSNYYKKIYRVKNDYFESSDEDQSFTKGIWVVSDSERRKIPIMIKKDLLDVEGFQADAAKCWKYVMIIAFLSTELLILNRDARFDSVRKVIKIIENSLKKMKERKMPRILKTIYIQTIHKKPKKTIEEMLEGFGYDKNVFDNIKFEYIYLPSLSVAELEDYGNNIIEHPLYKKYLEELLTKINKTKNYNSVGSLIDYIDQFNETVNGNSGFNSQTIVKDLEIDFNGIYNRHENKLKNDLTQKIKDLKKLERLDETFEEFIEKQENLLFTFEIKNDEFTFYGGCDDFNKIYENLRREKSFKVEPTEIFLDIYNTQKSALRIQEEKRLQEEKAKKEEEERKRQLEERKKREEEEDRKREEERKRQEEERKKREEEEDRKREEERRRQEEERKRKEEEEDRKREEERRRQEEERKKKEEEEDRKREEERKRQEEERKKEEERIRKEFEENMKKMKEEERKKQEEERKKLEEERKKKLEEERKRQEEEEKKRQEERRRKEEEERKRQEEEEKKRKEERRKQEEERKKREEEEDRKREEERKRLEEERKKRIEEEEKKRQEERRKQEEERRKKQQEEDRKREEERKRQEEERKRKEEERRKKEEEERRKIEEKENILKEFVQKKRDINNYFAKLKFMEKIDLDKIGLKLEFKIASDQVDFLNEQVEELKKFIKEKFELKKKEWNDQIERAKWKTIVQAQGEMKCKNGHDLDDNVCCSDCHGPIYWADSDEKYVICKGCKNNGLSRISGKIIHRGCGAESLCTIKWISGYKP